MRVLITGSSGQIGTNLALRLLAEGHSVFGVDRRSNTWTNAFPTLLQDLAAPHREFHGGIGGAPYPPCDIVVHLAANAKVYELVEYPHRALENITLTFNVLEFCRAHNLPIIFSSSREVYGDIQRYLTAETSADFSYTESPYSASKISGEALVYAYARCYGLNYLIFRFSNVYGRYDNDIERMERVIPLFIRKISRGEPVTVFGKDKILDFTYVDDCVDGIIRGMQRLLAGEVCNQTINLAYGQGNSLVHMAELVGAALEREPDIIVAPAKRLGEVTYYVADLSLARDLLGYSPHVPLAEGIRRAVAWARGEEHS
ncbi:NAD-dependent epimerase/dehydratase family protein [Candidatus Viridilinea mediisalina]|uniref:Nucleoside-diphosphate sugar epimerase n=1 Tax=Candidatus Viridilinea mediisalina TaxID=2024553 RepID=A0A2A6RGT3_9CHLR|nr:NAD-dependent epimerase/dehydratase family protein [Candidatus Viridilinea mediisalina]PDW02151.1 nucleoside-diphosphate sugar epimerase [Candidatus Viridilinea mediisalina]